MRNKKNHPSSNFYYYQPELATSIIFWSLTFGVFFLGVISVLEKSSIFVPIVIFLLFCLLFFLSLKRKIIIEQDRLNVETILKSNEQEIILRKIKKLSIGKYGFTITMDYCPEESYEFIMSKKRKQKFIEELTKHEQFHAKISSIQKSVDLE